MIGQATAERQKRHPADLVSALTNFHIPVVEFEETPLDQALDWTFSKYFEVLIDAPGRDNWTYEIKLPPAIRMRRITWSGTDVPMIEVIHVLTKDLEVEITFDHGLVTLRYAPEIE